MASSSKRVKLSDDLLLKGANSGEHSRAMTENTSLQEKFNKSLGGDDDDGDSELIIGAGEIDSRTVEEIDDYEGDNVLGLGFDVWREDRDPSILLNEDESDAEIDYPSDSNSGSSSSSGNHSPTNQELLTCEMDKYYRKTKEKIEMKVEHLALQDLKETLKVPDVGRLFLWFDVCLDGKIVWRGYDRVYLRNIKNYVDLSQQIRRRVLEMQDASQLPKCIKLRAVYSNPHAIVKDHLLIFYMGWREQDGELIRYALGPCMNFEAFIQLVQRAILVPTKQALNLFAHGHGLLYTA